MAEDGAAKANENQGWFQRWKPLLVVLVVKVLYAAMNVIIKRALDHGMSTFVFVAYRNLIAWLVVTPSAIYFKW